MYFILPLSFKKALPALLGTPPAQPSRGQPVSWSLTSSLFSCYMPEPPGLDETPSSCTVGFLGIEQKWSCSSQFVAIVELLKFFPFPFSRAKTFSSLR